MLGMVAIFSKVPFDAIAKRDRLWTCYMLACLASVNFGSIANPDVRKVFALGDEGKYRASRIIKDAPRVP